jgi:hypothetical protein
MKTAKNGHSHLAKLARQEEDALARFQIAQRVKFWRSNREGEVEYGTALDVSILNKVVLIWIREDKKNSLVRIPESHVEKI